MKEKFIVIDGIDGSGKTTQTDLLIKKLKSKNHTVETISFPQYNQKSAGLVEEYLSGKFGSIEEVGPYRASIFYACDRYDGGYKIKKAIAEGKTIIATRYVSANMGHQGAKIEDEIERKKFFDWLYELEYEIFQIPKPDLVLILDVKAKIAQELLCKRDQIDWKGKTRDLHEENLKHLKQARLVYQYIAENYPGTHLIKCIKDNKILPRENIHEMIWNKIKFF